MLQALSIIAATIIGVSGQILIKKGISAIGEVDITKINFPLAIKILTNSLIILGLALSALAAFFWILILSKNKLSYIYPITASLFYVGIFFASKIFLKESLNSVSILGILIIFIGIVILSRGN